MPHINPVDANTAPSESQPLLAGVQEKLGMVPNLLATLANAPAVLGSYLRLSDNLGKGQLSAQERELVALAVSEANGCAYCVAAHNTIGGSLGLGAEQVADARHGTSKDARTAALLGFTTQVLETKGNVGEAQLATFKAAGWTDADALEVVGNVALNTLTNYANRLAGTEIDFPAAPELAASGSCAVGS